MTSINHAMKITTLAVVLFVASTFYPLSKKARKCIEAIGGLLSLRAITAKTLLHLMVFRLIAGRGQPNEIKVNNDLGVKGEMQTYDHFEIVRKIIVDNKVHIESVK